MKFHKFDNKNELYRAAADFISSYLRENPKATIALPAGNTPTLLYRELVEDYKKKKNNFSSVRAFNLDEFYGLPRSHSGSFNSYVRSTLLDHVNINEGNIRTLNGEIQNHEEECADYEADI